MTEELEVLKTVAWRLEAAGMSYMVTESMALSYYAVPRMTKLDWARQTRSEVQLADVRSLLACVAGLDRAYLGRWVGRLGLESLYREVGG